MVRISSVCYYQGGQGTPYRSKYLEKDGSVCAVRAVRAVRDAVRLFRPS